VENYSDLANAAGPLVMSSSVFPFATTLISALFTYSLLLQYLHRRKLHQLLWAIALAMFSLTAFFEAYSEVADWNVPIYKVYYVMAAFQVFLLGAGTIFLFHSRGIVKGRWVPYSLLSYGLVILLAMSLVASFSEVRTDKFVSGVAVAGLAMAPQVRAFSPFLTVPGSIMLIGGAAYSFLKTRLRFNLFIGLGALGVGITGVLARAGAPEYIYLGEMLGIAAIYWGFLESDRLIRRHESRTLSPARPEQFLRTADSSILEEERT
jgi:hypothetical protein